MHYQLEITKNVVTQTLGSQLRLGQGKKETS